MEVLFDIGSRKSYLVPVWRIAVRRRFRDDLLWQFTSACFCYWCGNITCTWYTHSLVNIRTTWQRVTNSTTNTSCSSTERLNFRWVIVGFIFEHEQPRFFDAIYIYLNFNRAGIDFVRHFHVVQTTVSTLITTKDCRHIHKRLWLFRTSQFVTHGNIFIVSCLQLFLELRSWKVNIFQFCLKSRVTAMVRPVGIQNFQFRFCWHTPNWFKIILNKNKIIHFHSQTLFRLVSRKIFGCISLEEIQIWNCFVRIWKFLWTNRQGDIFETRINWIQKIMLHRFQLICINILINQIKLGSINRYVAVTTK